MKKYEVVKHRETKFTIYLESPKSESVTTWLENKEEVLHVHNANKFVMVDFTPRCDQKDIERIFKELNELLA